MTAIFKYMMEAGYYPSYECTHIQFEWDGNITVVECENGLVSVRIYFSIEDNEYEMFVEASNLTMADTYAVKPVMLDRENIVFSCEFFCDNINDFKSFFPRALDCLMKGLDVHKAEMRKLLLASEVASATIPATEESMTGRRKIFS